MRRAVVGVVFCEEIAVEHIIIFGFEESSKDMKSKIFCNLCMLYWRSFFQVYFLSFCVKVLLSYLGHCNRARQREIYLYHLVYYTVQFFFLEKVIFRGRI